MYTFGVLCACLCLVYDEPSELGCAEFGRRLSSLDARLHALVAWQLSYQRTILYQHPRWSPLSRHFKRPISCRTCTADHQLTDTVHVCVQTRLWRPANGTVLFATTTLNTAFNFWLGTDLTSLLILFFLFLWRPLFNLVQKAKALSFQVRSGWNLAILFLK